EQYCAINNRRKKEIDSMNRISLSMKQLIPKPEGYVDQPAFERGPRPAHRGFGDGGGRGGRPRGDR
ncbi:MAG: hypothetical protein AAB606_02155, partial [Patescibacteria group bacterium]